MNIEIVINAKEKICLVYDEEFEEVPLYAVYDIVSRQIDIVFISNESSYPIDWKATDEMAGYLLVSSKLLLIRMENKKPVEGYDISLLMAYKGRIIETYYSNDKGFKLFINAKMQAALRLPSKIRQINPDTIEFDGLTGSFSLKYGKKKLADIISLPKKEEFSALQRLVLSCDRINVIYSHSDFDAQNGNVLKNFVPLTIIFKNDVNKKSFIEKLYKSVVRG